MSFYTNILNCSNPPSFGITDIDNITTKSLQQKSSRTIMPVHSAYKEDCHSFRNHTEF